jgi:hypothetical protein
MTPGPVGDCLILRRRDRGWSPCCRSTYMKDASHAAPVQQERSALSEQA